ncbi:hypothetical protein SAMN05444285_12157 [Draconibacterium orientale]|uniref:DUF6565 domain-containing protein n=1 Tax=Draconibacterium orientale TaxID=1168034 RepID=A0A1I0GPT9_9BACT|nr:DUF6565 domain-containing protein [Draconibacterium orientale]SET73086.1 hypothetical protein SAMN05444285_12157 [Draconibacterium orientale]
MKYSKYLIVCCLLWLFACSAPISKEDYLDRFERFVERVENNHKKYGKKDWEWADEKFEKYNWEWYLEYRDDFTIEDQLKIKGLIIKYHALKNKTSVGDMLRDLFKDDVNKIGDKIEKYVDEDLDEDLDKIIDGATEIGDSAIKAMEDAVRKIDESF